MSDATICTAEKLLAGFAKLAPEDQQKVRAELMKGTAAVGGQSCCDPATMMAQMMEGMKAKGCDPMAMCKVLMEKTQSTDHSAVAGRGGKEGGC